MWKTVHDVSYPIKVQMKANQEKGMATRKCTRGEVVEVGSSTKKIKSFKGSALRLWNFAPARIRNALTLWKAKPEIKKFCFSLPVKCLFIFIISSAIKFLFNLRKFKYIIIIIGQGGLG